MPKEVINHSETREQHSYDDDGKQAGTNMCVDPRLTLHWSTLNSTELRLHGGVSLSITSYPVLSIDEYNEAESWPPPATVEQYTHELDRETLNKLIRLLRKARDAAYGRDE